MAKKAKTKYVAYYRVSTKTQGESGLGLAAQKESVLKYCNGNGVVVGEFEEIESGKKNERPQLHAAIEEAKRTGAKLAIAKLDRLGRSASFIFALRDSGIDFVCIDMPDLNTLTLGIFASMAQYEAEIISARTKAALAAKKAQGFKLGTPENLTQAAREKGYKMRREAAKENQANKQSWKIVKDLREQGKSLNYIAKKLNEYGIKGANGGKFYPATIKKLVAIMS